MAWSRGPANSAGGGTTMSPKQRRRAAAGPGHLNERPQSGGLGRGQCRRRRARRANAPPLRESARAVRDGRACSPDRRLGRHLALEPGFRKRPVPDDGLRGHLEDRRRFLGAEPAEEPPLARAGLSWIVAGERLERPPDRHERPGSTRVRRAASADAPLARRPRPRPAGAAVTSSRCAGIVRARSTEWHRHRSPTRSPLVTCGCRR